MLQRGEKMSNETKTYLDLLNDARARVWKILQGLDHAALNWRPTPDASNSLFALATHCLGAERRWIHQEVGAQSITRDRDAEFRALAENIATLQLTYAQVALLSQEILARLTAQELDALRGDAAHQQTVRWCILHIVEHYNEHIGQMALTRQLWENRHARLNEI